MPELIDRYLPRFDVRERHHLRVHASPAAAYAALRTADFARSPVVGLLLALRAIPAALSQGVAGMRALTGRGGRAVTLASFEERGFRILEDREPEELVLGLEGQFWRASGGVCTPSVDAFLCSTPAAGMARAVWNFRVWAKAPDSCEISTETRVLCSSSEVRRRFLPYWWIIRLGSGAIRGAMLRAIRDEAERGANHEP